MVTESLLLRGTKFGNSSGIVLLSVSDDDGEEILGSLFEVDLFFFFSF